MNAMDFLFSMHARLPTTILIVLAVLIVWSIVNYARDRTPSAHRAVLWIAEWLIVAEVLIGVALLLDVRQPVRMTLHIIYAAVAALTLPVALAYARERDSRSAQLIYALACLFLSAIVLRAQETGG